MPNSKSLLFFFSLLFFSCGSAEDPAREIPEVNPDNTEEASPSPAPTDYEQSLYSWVDRLNMRDQPNSNGKIVAKLETSTELTATGERSATEETIVLRGVLYVAPWVEVTTPAGEKGWVFGGAVKTEDEFKGNAPLTETKFNFPVFGEYDLSEWEKMSETAGDGEGDFDQLTSRYKKNGQQLEIESYEGEYGYGYFYNFYDTDGSLLKERHLQYSNDLREIREEVTDHSGLESIRYFRKQATPGPYQQLNSRPLMAIGNWEQEVVKAPAAHAQ